MVFMTSILLKQGVKKLRSSFKSQFLDSIRLTVSGGHGGSGLPKLGGIGGQGGCICFRAKEGASLRHVIKKYQTKRVAAFPGEDSHKYQILGKRGADVSVDVPLGVTVIREDGKVIAELDEDNKVCLAAGGGPGGCAGNSFIGQKGQSQTLTLDLKLIADVGLVGFPNAGKSTFLKAVSNAKPRIASYPFTTIKPQLGIVEYEDYRQISIADLPGLIEGAHANLGMGHKFLKHVERTRMLLLIVDVMGFQLSPKHPKRNCLETIFALNKELELYDESLLFKPTILLVNKMDLDGSSEVVAQYGRLLKGKLEEGLEQCPEHLRPVKLLNFERIIPMSAKHDEDMNKVKAAIRDVLDLEAEKHLKQPDFDELVDNKMREKGPMVV